MERRLEIRTGQLIDLAGGEISSVDVRFVADDASGTSQLAELVRLLQQRESARPETENR